MTPPGADRPVVVETAAPGGIEDANRVEVVGPVHAALFPGMCARCGAGADLRTLPVVKLFWRTSDDSSYYVTQAVDAPFCAGCVRAHERELQPIDPSVRQRLLRKWLVEALPYFVPLGVCLWLLAVFVPKLVPAVLVFRRDDAWEAVVWGAVSAFFGLLALMFVQMIRRSGRSLILDPAAPVRGSYVRIERGPLGSRFTIPVEPTSALRAVDFTDDRSELFEPERHLFTFQNGEVAARFVELNAGREWDPASPRALWARTARWVLTGVVVLVGLYFILQEWLH